MARALKVDQAPAQLPFPLANQPNVMLLGVPPAAAQESLRSQTLQRRYFAKRRTTDV